MCVCVRACAWMCGGRELIGEKLLHADSPTYITSASINTRHSERARARERERAFIRDMDLVNADRLKSALNMLINTSKLLSN